MAQRTLTPPEPQPAAVVAETAPPPVKKCQIEQVLGTTLHALLKIDPTNKMVRAHCLNKFKRELPPELVEYNSIKDWIESNIEFTLPSDGSSYVAIEVDVTHSYYEDGTCNYREYFRGSGIVQLTQADLDDILGDALDEGWSFESFMEAVRDRVREDAPEVTNMVATDTEHSYHEAQDSDGHETEINTDLTTAVRRWLEEYDPERLETLDEN